MAHFVRNAVGSIPPVGRIVFKEDKRAVPLRETRNPVILQTRTVYVLRILVEKRGHFFRRIVMQHRRVRKVEKCLALLQFLLQKSYNWLDLFGVKS